MTEEEVLAQISLVRISAGPKHRCYLLEEKGERVWTTLTREGRLEISWHHHTRTTVTNGFVGDFHFHFHFTGRRVHLSDYLLMCHVHICHHEFVGEQEKAAEAKHLHQLNSEWDTLTVEWDISPLSQLCWKSHMLSTDKEASDNTKTGWIQISITVRTFGCNVFSIFNFSLSFKLSPGWTGLCLTRAENEPELKFQHWSWTADWSWKHFLYFQGK